MNEMPQSARAPALQIPPGTPSMPGNGPKIPAENAVVVLLAAETLAGAPDLAGLRQTLAAPADVRLLIRVADEAGLRLAAALAQAGIPADLLLAHGVPPPDGASANGASMVRMPPGSTIAELNELALALSDVLIAAPAAADPLLARAKALEKPICPPGCRLGCAAKPAAASVSRGLDPDMTGWHARGRGVFGRFEQMWLEVLAFDWLGRVAEARAKSRSRMRKCVRRLWGPVAYFAPDQAPGDWRSLCPDRAAVDPATPLVARFDRLDRSALHGSYIHRDMIWVTHIAAAFAVLFAVAGAIHGRPVPDGAPEGGHSGAIAELLALLLIAGLIAGARSLKLQDRWIACRLGAEQLRIARMCLPLLVVPPALATVDRAPQDQPQGKQDFARQTIQEVKRAVRDQGLPRLPEQDSVMAGALWLQLIVEDQALYHRANSHKLKRAEQGLGFISASCFALALAGVLVHFFWDQAWLLLFTAAGPAFAAAFHGVETRLGIVHRAGLSDDAQAALAPISAALVRFIAHPPASADLAWAQLRANALAAADAMGRENQSWHGLLRRSKEALPA